MSDITKPTSTSPATNLVPDTNRFGPFPAGEDIAAGDACYQKAADGKIYRSLATTTATDETNIVDGYATAKATAGQRQPVTLYSGVKFPYGTGLTPGVAVFLSGVTAGGLATTSIAGQTKVLGRIMADGVRVILLRSY